MSAEFERLKIRLLQMRSSLVCEPSFHYQPSSKGSIFNQVQDKYGKLSSRNKEE